MRRLRLAGHDPETKKGAEAPFFARHGSSVDFHGQKPWSGKRGWGFAANSLMLKESAQNDFSLESVFWSMPLGLGKLLQQLLITGIDFVTGSFVFAIVA